MRVVPVWGQTQTLREQGIKVERWHWVYMAKVFRLDHRGRTAGQRAVITQRGYVATRLGLEAQQKKLQTQIEYFEHNAHRMKYKETIAAREAVAAGTATAEQIKRKRYGECGLSRMAGAGLQWWE